MLKIHLEPVSDPIDNKEHALFKKVFLSEEGKQVIDTLSDFACMFYCNVNLTPYQSAWIEGRRSLFLDIATFIRGVSQEVLDQLIKQRELINKGEFPWKITNPQTQQTNPWTMW